MGYLPPVASRIHFDTRWFGEHGIGRFASELFGRLPGAVPLRIPGPKLSAYDPLACTLAAARLRDGCYFSPGFNPPLASPVPVVFTIHDLIHLKVPSESSPLRRLYYRAVVRPAARRAWRVLTVSEHSRRDILAWCGVEPECVRVVGNGLSGAFSTAGPTQERACPFLLHVGRRTSHKNIDGLLAAFARSRARHEVELVFTGAADEATVLQARALGVEQRIAFAGRVGDEELAALYRGARALVFPSFYEGFGLPVVEAMGCGTPVITASTTSMAEVAGEGNALLVEPTDADALAQAIDRIVADAPLRELLSQRGIARAESFRWEHVAERVSEALADA